jgi:hypothetical protein
MIAEQLRSLARPVACYRRLVLIVFVENRFRTFLKTQLGISIFIDGGFVQFLKLQFATEKSFTEAD